MNYPDLFCFPCSRIKGLGDEPSETCNGSQPVKVCSHGLKRDEHTSVPKELVSYAKAVNMKARG